MEAAFIGLDDIYQADKLGVCPKAGACLLHNNDTTRISKNRSINMKSKNKKTKEQKSKRTIDIDCSIEHLFATKQAAEEGGRKRKRESKKRKRPLLAESSRLLK